MMMICISKYCWIGIVCWINCMDMDIGYNCMSLLDDNLMMFTLVCS